MSVARFSCSKLNVRPAQWFKFDMPGISDKVDSKVLVRIAMQRSQLFQILFRKKILNRFIYATSNNLCELTDLQNVERKN